MKVWHLISNRWNSAISEYALSTARSLQILGCKNTATPLLESPAAQRFANAEILVEAVPHFGPSAYARLKALRKEISPDVIITYGGPETTAALFLKGSAKLVRFHGYAVDDSLLAGFTRKLSHQHVDLVLAPSQRIARSLQLPCPVAVVPLGCDEGKFQRSDVTRSERPELLIFGRFDPVKGHREFLPLFRQILEAATDLPRPKLVIAGLPENLSVTHLQEAVKTSGVALGDVTILAERIADVAGLISKATVGVISSLGSEAICRVAEEFLLCGTPVAVTEIGSLPEVIAHESFGVNYASNAAPSAAIKIAQLLQSAWSEGLAAKDRRAALARSYFSLGTMSENLGRVLKI